MHSVVVTCTCSKSESKINQYLQTCKHCQNKSIFEHLSVSKIVCAHKCTDNYCIMGGKKSCKLCGCFWNAVLKSPWLVVSHFPSGSAHVSGDTTLKAYRQSMASALESTAIPITLPAQIKGWLMYLMYWPSHERAV